MRKGRLIKEIFPITATSPRTAVSRPLAGAGKNQCSLVGLAAAVPTSPSPPRVAPTGRQAPPAGFVLAPLLPARTPARTNARANAADSLDGSTPGLRVSAGEFASSSDLRVGVHEMCSILWPAEHDRRYEVSPLPALDCLFSTWDGSLRWGDRRGHPMEGSACVYL